MEKREALAIDYLLAVFRSMLVSVDAALGEPYKIWAVDYHYGRDEFTASPWADKKHFVLDSGWLRDNVAKSDSIYENSRIMAEVVRLRIEEHYPNSVKEVEIWWDEGSSDRQIAVRFHNKHEARGSISQYRSGEFLALCAMMFDLPEKKE